MRTHTHRASTSKHKTKENELKRAAACNIETGIICETPCLEIATDQTSREYIQRGLRKRLQLFNESLHTGQFYMGILERLAMCFLSIGFNVKCVQVFVGYFLAFARCTFYCLCSLLISFFLCFFLCRDASCIY